MKWLYDEHIKHVVDGDSDYFEGAELDIIRKARSIYGDSLLSVAASKGQLRCCQVICRRCPQLLYQANRNGWTVMHAAASEGKEKIVSFLLHVEQDLKSEVNERIGSKLVLMQDISEYTALHVAAYNNHLRSAKMLLAADLSNKLLGMVNCEGETALHIAVRKQHFEMVVLLVEDDPHFEYSKDQYGRTPISIAYEMARSGDTEKAAIIRRFLTKDQPLQCRLFTESTKWTLLQDAVHKADLRAVEDIIDLWPDRWEFVDEEGKNLLHLAVRSAQIEVVECILRLKNLEDSVLNGKDKFGDTPLHVAVASENYKIVSFLLGDSRITKMAENIKGKTALNLLAVGNKGWPLLHHPAQKGNISAVKEIIKFVPNCWEVVDEESQNFLHLAAMFDKIEVVEYGLELKTLSEKVLNGKDIHGNTPLHVAISCGNQRIASALLQDPRVDKTVENNEGEIASNMGPSVLFQCARKGDIDFFRAIQMDMLRKSTNKDGESVFSVAAMERQFDCCEVISERCPDLLYQPNKNGLGILHMASSDDKHDIVKYLLESWSKMEKRVMLDKKKLLGMIDNHQETALHYAVKMDNLKIVKLLVQADPNFVYSANESGNTPLSLALEKVRLDDHTPLSPALQKVRRGDPPLPPNVRIRNLLIRKQHNQCMHKDENGQTLLHHATNKNDLSAIKEIISSWKVSSEWVDDKGENFLHLATRLGRREIVEYILKEVKITDKVLNEKNDNGETPLHIAISSGNQNIALLLLYEHRVNKWIPDKQGNTVLKMVPSVLFQCASNGDTDFFMKIEVDILGRSKDEDGESALSIAAREGHLSCCQVICEKCPNLLYQQNKKGAGVLHTASSNNKQDIVKYLLISEAKMDKRKLLEMKDEHQETALHYAVKSHHFEIVELLVEADPDFVYSANESGNTPLFLAMEEALLDDPPSPLKVKIRNLLIKKQRNECMNKDENGRTLLHHATIKNDLSAIRNIIDSWEECLEFVDNKGENFLHLASRLGYGKIIEYIVSLKNTSDEVLNGKNDNGETPLHIAISSENQKVALPLLYHHRVNKWITDEQGNYVIKSIRFNYDKRRAGVHGLMDEKELKDQSDFDLLVGALISTVAFTAGITVPGGFISDGPNRGKAILHRNRTFEAFVVSNTIALSLSLFAVFTHFCVKSLDEKETAIQLTVAKFCSIGSIYALMVAFVMGSFSVLSISIELAITVSGICCCFFGCSFYSLWRMRRNKQKYRPRSD